MCQSKSSIGVHASNSARAVGLSLEYDEVVAHSSIAWQKWREWSRKRGKRKHARNASNEIIIHWFERFRAPGIRVVSLVRRDYNMEFGISHPLLAELCAHGDRRSSLIGMHRWRVGDNSLWILLIKQNIGRRRTDCSNSISQLPHFHRLIAYMFGSLTHPFLIFLFILEAWILSGIREIWAQKKATNWLRQCLGMPALVYNRNDFMETSPMQTQQQSDTNKRFILIIMAHSKEKHINLLRNCHSYRHTLRGRHFNAMRKQNNYARNSNL